MVVGNVCVSIILSCVSHLFATSIFRTLDEETGQKQWMVGIPGVNVSGGHEYEGPNGTIFSLTFTADEHGYYPTASHIPEQVQPTKEVQAAKAAFTKLFKEAEDLVTIEELQKKIAQFAPVDLTADISNVPKSEKMALEKLIEAARLIDRIFNLQAWEGYPQRRKELSNMPDALSKVQLEYFDIMRGPWDRLDEFKAFATESMHPDGAGFYPENLTEEEFLAYIESHPEQKDKLESLVTLVVRENNGFNAIPYSSAFSTWLIPAANKLKEAANLTEDATLKKFLISRAAAFLSDDYYESDKDWIDLESTIEITVGPFATYEDKLMGLKGSFFSFVTITDSVESEKLHIYKSLLPEMAQNLPIPEGMKNYRSSKSVIKVVNVVFTSGYVRIFNEIAFNLPEDGRLRQEKGDKTVILRNAINMDYNEITRLIAQKIIDPDQLKFLDQDAFFNWVLFHEFSHALGPAFVGNNKTKGPVSKALKASFVAIEEGKADVMGAHNVLFMIQKGMFPQDFCQKFLVTYFGGLFQTIRFSVDEAHGKGAAMQINYHAEHGGATFNKLTGRYHINADGLERSIGNLVTKVYILQYNGDKEAVDQMFETYGKLSEDIKQALSSVEDVPVTLKPRFLLAGE